MKKLILVILYFSPAFLFAQKATLPVDTSSNLITYQEVVQVDSTSKNEIYARAHDWFTKTFNSTQDFIDVDDPTTGKIIGKKFSMESYPYMMTGIPFNLNCTIAVTIKDNRYKYEISSFLISYVVQEHENQITFPLEKYNTMYVKGRGTDYSIAKRVIPIIDTVAKGWVKSLKSALKQSSNW